MENIFYGAVIVLRHEQFPAFLYSDRRYYSHPGCSDQQLVAAVTTENSDCYWLLKPANAIDPAAVRGDPIRPGDVVRLEHVPTKRNLHTHGDKPAPSTRSQKEVTCYGENGLGNNDDNWIVELPGGGTAWLTGQRVRLVNQSILAALHSHEITFINAGETFQEVTGHPDGHRDQNDYWNAFIRTSPPENALTKAHLWEWRDWTKDSLSIISSACSITGITLLWLHATIGNVPFKLAIPFGLAWAGTFVIFLLVIGSASISQRLFLARGLHIVWAVRVLSWLLSILLGWLVWIGIFKLVLVLMNWTTSLF